jgi:hypothetical protein
MAGYTRTLSFEGSSKGMEVECPGGLVYELELCESLLGVLQWLCRSCFSQLAMLLSRCFLGVVVPSAVPSGHVVYQECQKEGSVIPIGRA